MAERHSTRTINLSAALLQRKQSIGSVLLAPNENKNNEKWVDDDRIFVVWLTDIGRDVVSFRHVSSSVYKKPSSGTSESLHVCFLLNAIYS